VSRVSATTTLILSCQEAVMRTLANASSASITLKESTVNTVKSVFMETLPDKTVAVCSFSHKSF